MGRSPCCDKTKVRKGTWTPEEDDILKNYIEKHGTGGNWISLPQKAGLNRCGKSCRLRWLNYLRPDIKHGDFTDEEDRIICNLYYNIGSRWSIIASNLPGRTDNDVKNYWNTKLKKKILAGKITNVNLVQNSPPISRHEQQYINYANPASSSSNVTNSITFPNHMLMETTFHHQQNFNPIALPHPNPMEFSDFGFSSSQEVSSISNSPSLGLDNSYGWSSSGGGGSSSGGGGSTSGVEPDQILEDFDFEWAYDVLNNGIGFLEKIEEEAGLNYTLNKFHFTS